MGKLDFKEIPEAGKATGLQDSFELFARDALEVLGFKILQHPSRGADGGRDLIVEEKLVGTVATLSVKWLVSCKHFAFSGRSVSPDDERNPTERVRSAQCDGFLGFYSTLPSTGLANLLRNLPVKVQLLDRERIESLLLQSSNSRQILERYFPVSMKSAESTGPVYLYDGIEPIECENCGKNLLEPPDGNWVLWQDATRFGKTPTSHYVDAHFACKDCDGILQAHVRARHSGERLHDSWDDIRDFLIPTVFIKNVMAILNGMNNGDTYEKRAFEEVKKLILAVFPHVVRKLRADELETLKRLQQIPSYLGGIG